MHGIPARSSLGVVASVVLAGCVIAPPPPTSPPGQPTAAADPVASTAAAGAWVSEEWASYTNPAMLSADFYLQIAIEDDGTFRGSWARYLCLTEAYGIWSCGKGSVEGAASGQLAGDGTGVIELEHLGSSALVWRADESGISMELPRDWQGDAVLFRSTVIARD